MVSFTGALFGSDFGSGAFAYVGRNGQVTENLESDTYIES